MSRLRTGILVGFLLASAGYLFLGLSRSLALAVAAVMVAHAGIVHELGVLDDPAPGLHDRPFSGTRLCGGLRTVYARDIGEQLSRRNRDRLGNAGARHSRSESAW